MFFSNGGRRSSDLLNSSVETGHVALVLFAGEVEDHGSVFAAFAPRPGFRDVIVILEAARTPQLVRPQPFRH